MPPRPRYHDISLQYTTVNTCTLQENKGDTGETRTRDPRVTSRARYHCATPTALNKLRDRNLFCTKLPIYEECEETPNSPQDLAFHSAIHNCGKNNDNVVIFPRLNQKQKQKHRCVLIFSRACQVFFLSMYMTRVCLLYKLRSKHLM